MEPDVRIYRHTTYIRYIPKTTHPEKKETFFNDQTQFLAFPSFSLSLSLFIGIRRNSRSYLGRYILRTKLATFCCCSIIMLHFEPGPIPYYTYVVYSSTARVYYSIRKTIFSFCRSIRRSRFLRVKKRKIWVNRPADGRTDGRTLPYYADITIGS